MSQAIMFLFPVLLFFSFSASLNAGLLKPRESESRTIQEMNGMWNFRADISANRNKGMEEKWWTSSLCKTGDVIPMPVPSSFNDITTDRSLQYFSGWVWYDREFYVSKDNEKKRSVLRIDSAHYYTMVWVNGEHVMDHDGGHLPFETDVSKYLTFSGVNRVTVAVNNTLGPHTLPPGTISYKSGPQYPPGYFVQNLQFDFFNYAGIHRRVRIYTTTKQYIDDITLVTTFAQTTGKVDYKVTTGASSCDGCTLSAEVVDMDGNTVAKATGLTGTLSISNVKLWWPYTMSKKNFTDMYTFKATLTSSDGVDIYRQPFGVRTVSVTKTQVLINNKPFYCHGVAKHEDSNIRGKGLDFPLIARDFNMLRWLGVNCFRTSHYPYAEEIMDEADRWGIAVIDECPGVGITTDENFSNASLAHHLDVMTELVTRDKNRPSVIMWSVANEPASNKAIAKNYFKAVISHTKDLDKTRLVTFVSAQQNTDEAAEFTDVQCFNRYFGWYEDTGHLDTIPYKLKYDLEKWYKRLQKPLIMTEYGADTVPGIHSMPSFVFTEEYQVEFLMQYHTVFDEYKTQFLAGEMVWNFADFMTDETVTRVFGNKKGLLTRDRQPKSSAHLIRHRYWSMINNDNVTLHSQLLYNKYRRNNQYSLVSHFNNYL